MRAVSVLVAAAVVCAAAVPGCTMAPPGAMPAYYVVVAGPEVVVRASGDEHVTGSVAIPGAAGIPKVFYGAGVFGGTDDRHFVIVVSRGGDLPGVADATVFRLTVSPDGRPGQPAVLNFDSGGIPVAGAALSRDGRMIALSLIHEFPPGPPYGSVEVINVATGATRAWTGQGAAGYWPGVPSWAGNGTVVVPWWHSNTHGTIPADLTGVRELDPAMPGGNLLAARLVAFPAPVEGLESAMIAPGGRYIVVSSCRAGQHHTATARVTELSATDGRLVRVLRTQFQAGGDVQDAILFTCQVLSVAGDGGHVLAQAFTLGRIDNGGFTPLPPTTPAVLPVSAAW